MATVLLSVVRRVGPTFTPPVRTENRKPAGIDPKVDIATLELEVAISTSKSLPKCDSCHHMAKCDSCHHTQGANRLATVGFKY